MDKITFENGLAVSGGELTVYCADPITREFTGITQEFIPAGIGLPAYAVAFAPPDAQSGWVARLAEDATQWEIVEDLRGHIAYNRLTRQASSVIDIGPLDSSLTLIPPATEFDRWLDDGWVTDETARKDALTIAAEKLQATKLQEVNQRTQLWQTQLALGMLAQSNKAKLIAWMEYASLLESIDPAHSADILWPEPPAA